MKPQRSLQPPAGAARRAALLLACLLLPHAHSPAAAAAQGALQDDRPITKETLIKSLEVGADPDKRVPVTHYLERTRERGVKFLLTPADERKIRAVGKYLGSADLNKLVNALRDNYRPAVSMLAKVEKVRAAPNPGGGVQVFVQVTVRNYGPPTVARKFNLRIMHATSASINFNAAPVALDEPFTVTEDGKEGETIRPEDAITRKTDQAMSTGASATGWLRFYLPSLPRLPPEAQLKPEFLRQPGIWYVVSFSDAAGETYEDAYKVD